MTEVVAGGETLTPSYVISSLPLRTTVGITEPDAPGEVRDAARGLRYREFLTVLLVIDGEDLFPDNWIYIHEPGVQVGRIQNFKSWSPWMVPNDRDASIGMEYFCFEGDDLWTMDDEDLVKFATREIQQLGLAKAEKVKFGFVARVHKAYPIYDAEYAERVATIRGWLAGIPNLIQVGRNGLHRYNNSDHSMLTAMRAVDNILLGASHDIWAVNAESVYHEEHQEPEQPYRNPPETEGMKQPLASGAMAAGASMMRRGGCAVSRPSGLRWRSAPAPLAAASSPVDARAPSAWASRSAAPAVLGATTAASPRRTDPGSTSAGDGSASQRRRHRRHRVGALVILGGIAFFIWYDARKRAPGARPAPWPAARGCPERPSRAPSARPSHASSAG